MRSPYAPSPGHGLVTNADVVDGTHVPRITTRQPFSCTRGAGSGLSLPHESVRSPTENRKVGGSTPPLATTRTAGQEPLTCGFVPPKARVVFRRPTVSDPECAPLARSYRPSYRTKRTFDPSLRTRAIAVDHARVSTDRGSRWLGNPSPNSQRLLPSTTRHWSPRPSCRDPTPAEEADASRSPPRVAAGYVASEVGGEDRVERAKADRAGRRST